MPSQIRIMTRDDVRLAVAWAAAEGWNPGRHDADCFFAADPGGFFMAFDGNTPTGCISAVAYDDRFGFIGFFIVRSDRRGHRIGIELGEVALAHLGDRCIGQDGVIGKVKNYERFGFRMAYRNIRFAGIAAPHPDAPTGLIPLGRIPSSEVASYDRRHFPAPRTAFLEKWISQPESVALGWLDEERHLAGYGVMRKCVTGHKVGPLFADSAGIAEGILHGLVNHAAPGEPFFLDIPEPNKDALCLCRGHAMKEVFATARMYNGKPPELPLDKIYGISSFELG